MGPEHHEVGVVEGNLASLALAQGDLDAAERHGRRALAIKESTLGTDHPDPPAAGDHPGQLATARAELA